MGIENRFQPLQVMLAGRFDIGRSLRTFFGAQAFHSAPEYLGMNLIRDIQRQHRNMLFPGEFEDRLQQAEIQLPALEIFGLYQHLPLVDTPGDVIIEVGLEGLLEIFDADGEIGIARIQALDDAQLVLVVFQAVVNLADEYRAFFIELAGQLVELLLVAQIENPGHGAGA